MHVICISPLLCQKCRGCNLAKLHTLGAQTAILGASKILRDRLSQNRTEILLIWTNRFFLRILSDF